MRKNFSLLALAAMLVATTYSLGIVGWQTGNYWHLAPLAGVFAGLIAGVIVKTLKDRRRRARFAEMERREDEDKCQECDGMGHTSINLPPCPHCGVIDYCADRPLCTKCNGTGWTPGTKSHAIYLTENRLTPDGKPINVL